MRANNYYWCHKKQADLEEPSVDDVFDVGTIANIIQIIKIARRHSESVGGRSTTRKNQSIK